MAITVFIVDDHFMVIEGIRSLLQNERSIEWAGHAMNAESCMSFLKNRQPDVILMDINLPEKNGIELCKEVKEAYPNIFIIGLSTFNQLSFIQKMLDNGASGYTLKNATQDELMEAITTVAEGKRHITGEVAQTLRKESESGIVLTRREKEVLELIANGMTNAMIAQHLFISITTVDTHRKNLLAKFDVNNTASLIKTAARLQLI